MSKTKRTLVLGTNGTTKFSTVKKLNSDIGGWFETLPREPETKYDCDAFVHEEGVLKGLAANPFSNILEDLGFLIRWEFGGVRGPVVLAGPVDDKGESTAVSDVLVKKVRDHLKTNII
jgi:hypothetical protein